MATNILLQRRLEKIFQKQGWDITKGKCRYIFDRYGLMLKQLSTEQQELILFLTEDFLYCPLENYPILFASALKKINKNRINESKQTFVLPIIYDNYGATTSSSGLPYICKTEVFPFIDGFNKNPIHFYQDIEEFHNQNKGRNNSLILFLDDFAGSGKSICDAMSHYRNEGYIKPSDDVIIVTLLAQKDAIKVIEKENYKIVTGEVRLRGISDCPRYPSGIFTDANYALRIMGELEESLGYKDGDDHRFGYAHSESLVSMMNTPDNTFPVFRINHTKKGVKWHAPFARV